MYDMGRSTGKHTFIFSCHTNEINLDEVGKVAGPKYDFTMQRKWYKEGALKTQHSLVRLPLRKKKRSVKQHDQIYTLQSNTSRKQASD